MNRSNSYLPISPNLNSQTTLSSVCVDQKKYEGSLIFQQNKNSSGILLQQYTNNSQKKFLHNRIQFNNDIMSTMQGEEKQIFQIQSAKKLIFIAVETGDLKLVKQLLDTYPLSYEMWLQKNHSEDTLLHCCIKNSKIKLIDYFLDINSEIINIGNKQKKTPIHYALIYNIQLFQYLLKKWPHVIRWDHQDSMKNSYYDYCEYFNCNQGIKKFVLSKMKVIQKKQICCWRKQKIQFLGKSFRNSEKKQRYFRHQVKFTKLVLYYNQIYHLKFRQSVSINQFEILTLIDSGGFAKVFKVRQKISQKIYALKAIEKSKLTHQYYHKYAKIQKEILIICNHPNIIKLYCTFENQNFLFLLLQFCQYGSIKPLIYSNKSINQSVVKLFVCQLVQAIQYLHHKSILYRDLKLQNICMDQKGSLKLIDFGLSKKLRSDCTTKSICGTYQYLPPEMINRQPYTFTVDWYMLGIVIYQILMKKTPFECNNFGGCKQILVDKIPQIFGISSQLQDLIYKLTEKQQVKRLGRNKDGKQIKNHHWFNDISWKSYYKNNNLHLLFNKNDIQNGRQEQQKVWTHYFQEYQKKRLEEQFVETDGWSSLIRNI